MNSFEERLGAALNEVQAMAPATDAEAGRAVFHDYVRGRRRRQRVTMAMRLAVVTIVASIGGVTLYARLVDAPGAGNPPVVTPDDRPGHSNVGQDDGQGNRNSCFKRSAGGCQLIG
jgi:hypothetical protein